MKAGWYIFLYHNISWEETPYTRGLEPTHPPNIFQDHLSRLSELGEFVSISEGLSRLDSGTVSSPTFSFWFDDGLVGVRKYALPLLEKYNVTGGLSVCSHFFNRQDFFWRFKLSYLSYIDGLRFLRHRLKKYGYTKGMSIKGFCLDNFSEAIVEEIDTVFRNVTSDPEREDAFRLFETKTGLMELKEKEWTLANHTAAHYPVGEDSFLSHFERQFSECEAEYKALFGEESKFWVLPFDRGKCRSRRLIERFRECANNRYLVLVGNKMNTPSNTKEKVIFRITPPVCKGTHLYRSLLDVMNFGTGL